MVENLRRKRSSRQIYRKNSYYRGKNYFSSISSFSIYAVSLVKFNPLFNRRFIINISSSNNSGQDVERIVNFIYDNGDGFYDYISADKLKEIIIKHREYKTFLLLEDKNGIVAIARWNWLGLHTVHILDCVVRPDYRSSKVIKYLINLGFKNNPRAENMIFERGYKYPNKKPKIYKVRRK